MPGPHQVVREDGGEVEAEEAAELHPVVPRGHADERLEHEQRRDDEEEPGRGALRRGQRDVARVAERERGLLPLVPAEPPAQRPKAANSRPMPPSSAISESTDQTITFAVDGVADARLRRPVVGVGVALARALRGGRPGRPGDEGGQLRELPAVGDRVPAQAVPGRRVGEEARVVPDQPAMGRGLRGRQRQRARALVVAVGAEVLDRATHRAVRPRAAVGLRGRSRTRGAGSRRCSRAPGRRRARRPSRTPSARCGGTPAGRPARPPPCRAARRSGRRRARGSAAWRRTCGTPAARGRRSRRAGRAPPPAPRSWTPATADDRSPPPALLPLRGSMTRAARVGAMVTRFGGIFPYRTGKKDLTS